jgi:hypothetical protein
VEAGGEKDHLGGIDGELATLGTAGETLDTDDITTTDVAVEVPVVSAVALISEDLNGGAISLDLVEDELLAGDTDEVNTTSDTDRNSIELLASLKVLELGAELRNGHVSVELVRVLGGVRKGGVLSQKLGTVLEVLSRVELILIDLLLTLGSSLGGSLLGLSLGSSLLLDDTLKGAKKRMKDEI